MAPLFFFFVSVASGPFHFFTVHATPSRFRGSTVLDVGMLEHADRGTYAMSKPAYTYGEKLHLRPVKQPCESIRQLSPAGREHQIRSPLTSLLDK